MKNVLLLFLFLLITLSSTAQTDAKRALWQQKHRMAPLNEQAFLKNEKQRAITAPKTVLNGMVNSRLMKMTDKSVDFSKLRRNVISDFSEDTPSAVIAVWVGEPNIQKEPNMGGSTQVLIADGTAVDGSDEESMDEMWNLFANGGQPLADFYEALSAKMPANADPTLDYSQGLVNEEHAVLLDLSERNTFDVIFAGVDSIYYYLPNYGFSNPAPEALQDNLTCEDKWLYFFDYSYWTAPQLVSIPPFEIEAIALETTPSSAELGHEPVTLTIMNTGNQPLTSIDFYLKIDGGVEIHESFTTPADSTLDMGEFLTYTFAAKADLSATGKYTIEARAEVANEYSPSNNSLTVDRERTTVGALPFFDSFDEELSNWAIIDRNGTNEYGSGAWVPRLVYDEEWNETYQAMYQYAEDRPGDDWLRTTRPYHLEQGAYHISFLQYALDETLPEVLNVYYGTSPDVASMTLLKGFTVTNVVTLKNIVNFEAPTAGDYYFAFQAASTADMFGLGIDDVEIAAGTLTPQPDLWLYQTVFDGYPSCELPGSAVVTVVNLGDISADITSFDLKYKLNDGAWQTKTVNEPLPAGAIMPVVIDGLDLSAVGMYTLTVTDVLENQITDTNDEAVATIEKTASVAALPYVSNFSNDSDVSEWVVTTQNGWSAEDGYYSPDFGGALISRCIELQPGDYVLSQTFKAGTYFELFDMYLYGNYSIRMGAPGTDPSEWTDTIASAERLYFPNDTTANFEFSVEEAGNYVFAFTAASFRLKEVSITAGTLGVPNMATDENEVTLSPNPVADFVHIVSKDAEIETVTINDLSGREIYRSDRCFGQNDCRIDVSTFSKGLYLVKIKTVNSENSYTKKMIVR
ncbi:MAG: T9SS type A sorting domain-containing protein [Prevotellaceae bacterium]|nr:T9SS type A sorting domain-containing protein [Prevotellaceae bacterium]